MTRVSIETISALGFKSVQLQRLMFERIDYDMVVTYYIRY